MMRNHFVLILILFFLAITLSGCGKDNTGTDGDDIRQVLITTQQVETMDLPIWITTVGQVHSQSAPTLAAEVDGRITKVLVDSGEAIEKGELLAETDTSTLVLRKQAAQAGLERFAVHVENGERRVGRFEALSAKNLSSQTQLDDAREQLAAFQADYKAAEAQLALVNDSLKKSRIIAPVSGMLQRRLIAEGDFVRRGQALFKMTRPDRLQAWMPFPETVALQVAIGKTVQFHSPLVPGKTYHGVISDLQPSIGPGNRAIMTITDIENPEGLMPEATIRGKLLTQTHKQAVLVPTISVVRRPAGETVYVIKDGVAQARLVEPGYHYQGKVEILSGLTGTEIVALDGAPFLTDGSRVKITEPGN